MLTFKDKLIEKDVANHVISKEELVNHLVKYYSVFEIADALADSLLEEPIKAPAKIVITEAEFAEHFKIRGFKDNGEVETRGRKKLTPHKPDHSF